MSVEVPSKIRNVSFIVGVLGFIAGLTMGGVGSEGVLWSLLSFFILTIFVQKLLMVFYKSKLKKNQIIQEEKRRKDIAINNIKEEIKNLRNVRHDAIETIESLYKG